MTASDGRMRLRMRVHRVSDAARLRRVLTMVAPLGRTHISKLLGRHTGALVSSRADLLRLGALFRLAAVSPHSAVFLPLRGNPLGGVAQHWADLQGVADLVVVRRDVPLRASAWPGVRARIRRGPGRGALASMQTPVPRDATPGRTWDWEQRQLSVAEHAETVLLSGSAAALYEAGDELTWCGNQVAVHRDIRRYGGPALLSQFNGDGGSWECMILAEDDIFRRRR